MRDAFREEIFMWMAIDLAKDAYEEGDRPFGCVIADRYGKIVGDGKGTERLGDPLRHSECEAIRRASLLGGGLLYNCTLFSTHEPCAMCCGAIKHAKLKRVVFGSFRGDLPDLFRATKVSVFDHLADTSKPPEVVGGLLRQECVHLWHGIQNVEREP